MKLFKLEEDTIIGLKCLFFLVVVSIGYLVFCAIFGYLMTPPLITELGLDGQKVSISYKNDNNNDQSIIYHDCSTVIRMDRESNRFYINDDLYRLDATDKLALNDFLQQHASSHKWIQDTRYPSAEIQKQHGEDRYIF